MFETARFNELELLASLVRESRTFLRRSIQEFSYPQELRVRSNSKAWPSLYGVIDEENSAVLDDVSGRAGVYALLTSKPNGSDGWHLRYIGHSAAKYTRQRLRSHLVWRNKRTSSGRFTGSTFDEVKKAVGKNLAIGVSFVELEPAAMRHYVEDRLIQKLQPAWNFHGTTAYSQACSERRCRL